MSTVNAAIPSLSMLINLQHVSFLLLVNVCVNRALFIAVQNVYLITERHD